MPEGDTIFRTARNLDRALAGSEVIRFDSPLPSLMRVEHDRRVSGRRIESVASRGKHLLMAFPGDLFLHTHMRMNGSWHLYRPGEPWRRPRRDMRFVIETSSFVAVGFNVPIVEFLEGPELARHRELRALGPDLLDPSFDRLEVLRRIRSHEREAIADVILDQRVVAGIGNVFKSEVLFVARVHPFRAVGTLTDADLDRIVVQSRRLLRENVGFRSQTLSVVVGRRTTRSLDPSAKLWVYGRAGLPCRKCGAFVRGRKTGLDARLTYWCPGCQPEHPSPNASEFANSRTRQPADSPSD
jgi:endonuclease-8